VKKAAKKAAKKVVVVKPPKAFYFIRVTGAPVSKKEIAVLKLDNDEKLSEVTIQKLSNAFLKQAEARAAKATIAKALKLR